MLDVRLNCAYVSYVLNLHCTATDVSLNQVRCAGSNVRSNHRYRAASNVRLGQVQRVYVLRLYPCVLE